MGISTIQSYRGAQIFEAIGLVKDFVDRYFTWTTSRIGGVGIDDIAEETAARHARAFPDRPVGDAELEWGGEYQWRREGEYHLFNPDTVFKLQHATQSGQYRIFKDYTRAVDEQTRNLATLRAALHPQAGGAGHPHRGSGAGRGHPQPLRHRRDVVGSISREAHETLAIAMNRIGGKSNTGEGGEDPARYTPRRQRRPRRSAIKQVASGRFGVTSEYLVNADELQIKMAQGAKPGEGGQLPGHKVYAWIAKVRYSTPGVGLISPPPHHDIYSIEDLAQLIYDLKNANPQSAHQREAGRGGGRRHGGGGRRQGARRRGPDLRPRRRHRRLAAHLDQARGRALGARPRGDAAGARAERAARPDHRAGGRPAEDRPRRGDRGAAGRGGVRLLHRAAGGDGLHHDAGVPSQYLPGGHRHPGPGAPRQVRGQARARR